MKLALGKEQAKAISPTGLHSSSITDNIPRTTAMPDDPLTASDHEENTPESSWQSDSVEGSVPEAANRPLVSIGMLCYNHERFVAEALDGVLAQTYTPLEIVIYDDCSTDKTPDVVAAKLADIPHRSDIRFIRGSRNQGLLGACDVAIRATRGEFVVLTCDDDIMQPELVSEMVEVWQREHVSLVTTNAEYIDEHSNSRGETIRDRNVPADDTLETSRPRRFQRVLLWCQHGV